MESASWWTICVFLADFVFRLGLSVRVITRRLPVGVSLAWLFVVVTFPFVGTVAYLVVGEMRLGQRRAARAQLFREPVGRWLADLRRRDVDWSVRMPGALSLSRMCSAVTGIPVTPGNRLELLADYEVVLQRLIRDIDSAQKTCHLEFYIWNEGGQADVVAEALLRAATRGVVCRVLLDDVGSREFLRSHWAQRLREGGVALRAALEARLWRVLFVRYDLRLHRKIVVIDGCVAYTGSQNLADPRLFKRSAGVGQWVDAMVRIEGPAVEPLGVIFLGDWALESSESIDVLRDTGNVYALEAQGEAAVQVVPSGPTSAWGAIERILVSAIYSAQRKLILTTPYFVPDEALMTALISAAQRGVDVTLILPAKVDSRLARWASQASQKDLVAAGVRVLLFQGGLLHTKSVVVDGQFSLFGSLNLDPRSLHLNFEITLAIYDSAFTAQLEALLAQYASHSHALNLAELQSRPRTEIFIEDVARLVGPLI